MMRAIRESTLVMTLPANITLQEKLYKWSYWLVAVICAISTLVLTGWFFNVVALKTLGAPVTAMYPLTALSFILISIAFYLLASRKRHYVAGGYAIVVLVLMVISFKLGASLFKWNDAIDIFLYGDKNIGQAMPFTRMAPSVSLGFILASVALLLTHLLQRRTLLPAQIVALTLLVLGLLALLGYLYKAEKMYGIILSTPMALPSGMCFVLFALAVLFFSPSVGLMALFSSSLTGGILTRVLIPASIIIPSVFGIIALSGYRDGQYNVEHGFVYYVLSIVVILVAFVAYYAFLFNKRDIAKQQTEQALLDAEVQARTIFEEAPEAIIMIDEKGKVRRWNSQAVLLFGWTKHEAMDRLLADMIIPVEYREAHIRGIQRFLSTGKGTIIGDTIDMPALTKDGRTLDVSLRISSLVINNQQFFVGFVRDITLRKKLERQLQTFNESLEREVKDKTKELTDMFERVTDGFIALDKDYRYTYVNERAREMIHKDPAELIGKCVWDVFPESVGSPTHKAFEAAMHTQKHVQNIDHYKPSNLWLESNIYPSANGLSVFMRDITRQREREQEVAEARILADKLIDSLPGVFYFYDVNGKFIRWNKKLEEVTGYGSDEIAVMHPVQLFPDDEKEYISGRIATVFEKGSNDAEADFLSKTGERTSYYFKAVLIEYNGMPCLLGSGIDITERKKAEERLKQSEQNYKLLFEKNPLPMWILSLPEYKVMDVNSACLQQYGYSRREFLALDIKDLLSPQELPKMQAQLNLNFRGLHHAGVWRHQNKEGVTIYADIMTHDIYYKDAPARLVLAKEVTEQYLAEERLKKSYDEIRELTEYLQKVREEERMRISHEIHDELGQLLTVLKIDISWINKRIPDGNVAIKKKISETLGMVDHTVKAVRRIASELRPALLDDLGLKAAMLWHIKDFENRSGVRTEVQLPEQELKLTDERKTALYRILQESLTNVSRHSEAGKVLIRMIKENNKVVMTITDNGKGFDPGKGSLKTLGLLGMKERALGMGGDYHIQSEPGKGTTVQVILPIEGETAGNSSILS